jgi:tetratricopeptide (TPR) repeat protein
MVIPVSVIGQKGVEDGSKYGHGEDSIRCVRSYAISHDFLKHKEFDPAMPYWKIPFDECPLISKNVYIDGVKLYRYLIEEEEDNLRRTELLDTLMLIYERRIQYFNEEGNVKGRQGVDLLRYGRDKIENNETAYDLLKRSLELRGVKTSDAVLASLMSCSLVLYNNGILDVGASISDYLAISSTLDKKILEKPTKKDLKDLKESINKNFQDNGPGDCDKLVEYFTPLLPDKTDDHEFLDMLYTLLKNRNCKKSDLYYNTAIALNDIDSSAMLCNEIAFIANEKGLYDISIEYYKSAIELNEDITLEADYQYGIAVCYSAMGNKQLARDYARKAISMRENWGAPYILIGQLYADSKDECGSLKLEGSIYWIAVDMFVKAKSIDPSCEEKANSQIKKYSPYFPSKDDAFFHSVYENSSYRVGCWINETTKARF